MKYLPHIALPLLMVVLLATSIVLPKLVQKNSPQGINGSSYVEYKAPEPAAYTDPNVVLDGNHNPSLLGQQQPAVARDAVDYDKLIKPFLSQLEAGEWDKAEMTLASISGLLPESMRSGLKISLDSARQTKEAQALAAAEKRQREAEVAQAKADSETAVERAQLTAKESTEKMFAMAKEAEELEKSRLQAEAALAVTDNDLSATLETKLINIDTAPENTVAEPTIDLVRVEVDSEAPTVIDTATSESSTQPGDATTSALAEIVIPDDSSVPFSFNSAQVPYEANATLDRVVSELRDNSRLGIQLRGYADSVGNPVYNAILSKARSQGIKDDLVAKGVEANRIEMVPFGSSVSPQGRSSEHRRVDLVFYEL